MTLRKVYGPYLRNDKRMVVLLYYGNNKLKTVSYPKYIYENHYKIRLKKKEVIHHIGGID